MSEVSSNEELLSAQSRQLDRLFELEERGEPVGGWKLGLTSGESRDAFGPGIRPFGFILASRILASGESLDWAQVGQGGIENEVCFLIGRDITEPVTAHSVIHHLGGVAPAFEINQRRIDSSSSPTERIVDGLANWGIVVGDSVPVSPGWAAENLVVTLSHEGESVVSVPARGHIDNQFESVARLANELLAFGRFLRMGDRVITGAFGRQAQPVAGLWQGDFGAELGTVSIVIDQQE